MDAVLVFDEAESLFGSRSDNMSSSTDRYAAMDVGGEAHPCQERKRDLAEGMILSSAHHMLVVRLCWRTNCTSRSSVEQHLCYAAHTVLLHHLETHIGIVVLITNKVRIGFLCCNCHTAGWDAEGRFSQRWGGYGIQFFSADLW